MPRLARGEYLNPNEIQVIHTAQRCVRRAFLCGDDPHTGQSYEHRRQWIRDRLEFLASIFATDSHAYNQLFPLAHKYLGFIDAAQRSNMESVNFLLKAKPSEKMSLLAWYYVMQSNAAAPVPSIGGTPTQNAGKDFGQELDLILSYKIAPRSDILFGYSHFWAGGKIANANDADFFYSQWTVNF